jgi:hypothetical protein
VILLLVLLVTPAMFVALPLEEINPMAGLAVGALFMFLGMMAACSFYLASQWAQGFTQGLSLWKTLLRLPALMALGVGISVVNSRAVLEALFGRQSPFVRTPKYNGDSDSETDPVAQRHRKLVPHGVIELVLGVLMIGCIVLSFTRPHTVVAMPFMVLFACGYFAVALPSLREALKRRLSAASSRAAQAEPFAPVVDGAAIMRTDASRA